MKQLQPVIWARGTFLNPQHLQLQDRFLESTLRFRQEALNYAPYGFTGLHIDQEALAGGQIAISSASGIMPDGLAFDIPSADAAPPAKQLASWLEDEESGSTLVYLALPALRPGGLNIAPEGSNFDGRFRAELALVRDENTGGQERPVHLARKNFRLLFEGEAQEGQTCMQIARLQKGPGGAVQLDPLFVPPLLDIGASAFLQTIVRRLVELLSAKSTMLAGMRRQKNQTLADFTAADIASFWLLYCLNSELPLFRHILESRRGHPEGLFAEMLTLGGALTTFSMQVQPRDFPLYDHENLGAAFSLLDEKLRHLLDTVIPSNFVSLALKQIQPFIYATALDDDKYLRNTRMYLAVSADVGEAELIQRVPALVKVCSANQIEILVRQALNGVTLTHLPVPPSAIPVKLNYQYYSLNQAGGAWEAITRSRNFAAYVPAEIPNANLELLILLPQTQ